MKEFLKKNKEALFGALLAAIITTTATLLILNS